MGRHNTLDLPTGVKSTGGGIVRDLISAQKWIWGVRLCDSCLYNARLVRPGCRMYARVAELVDALDLGSSGATRGSSSLPFRTMKSDTADNTRPGKTRHHREVDSIHASFS